ncbi:hypothetical protein [Mucilaginibacter sp.]|uniref:hypothetical protein n=1 Tax=Mucilaginibacter sp. TaxID=1882438 RepID=UPI0035BBCE83
MTLDNEETKPNAYQVEDDSNLEEKDLQRTFLFGKGDEEKSGDEPDMEAEGAGGERFGQNNDTPSGDDKNNPSQNAGYSNEYFRRSEPLEEHPEFQNFKDSNQLGQSNYNEASGAAATGQSDEENKGPERDSNDNKQDQNTSYQTGTADNEGATEDDDNSVAGYGELPEQQKVGGTTESTDNENNKPVAD